MNRSHETTKTSKLRLSEASKRDIKAVIEKACEKTQEEDIELLKINASEWAVAHRLALHIERLCDLGDNYKVDCEYNKAIESKTRKYITKKGLKNETIRPDIIVHQRNDDTNNLVVIELKKKEYLNRSANKTDKTVKEDLEQKLETYKKSMNYKYGCIITITKDSLYIEK